MKKWNLSKIFVALFAIVFISSTLTVVFAVMTLRSDPDFLKNVSLQLGHSVAQGRDYQELAEESLADVQKIVVKSTHGDVDFQTYDGSTLKIEYSGKVPKDVSGSLIHINKDAAGVMTVELEIPAAKTAFSITWDENIKNLNFSDVDLHAKFYLPKSFSQDLEVYSTNGALHFNDISAHKILANSTNGDVEMQMVKAQAIHIHVVNGEIVSEGTIAKNWDIENVSGDIRLALNEGQTYQFNLNTVSGKIENNTNSTAPANTKDVGFINAKTISGNIQIEKYNESAEDRE